MSEQNGETTAAPAEHQIPKYRLDEEIAKVRALQAENQGLKGLVQNFQQLQRPPTPQKEDEFMTELKESNPKLYARFKRQEIKLQQMSTFQLQQHEMIDQDKLVREIGNNEANKYGQAIEVELKRARDAGNFGFSRLDFYRLFKGQEAINNERTPKSAPQSQAKVETRTSYEDAPPSDPKSQGISSSAARVNASEVSLEELEKRLSTQEF